MLIYNFWWKFQTYFLLTQIDLKDSLLMATAYCIAIFYLFSQI